MSNPAVQGRLDLRVEKEVEVDGVGMGVLSDGTPYLTGRGLARLCGVDTSVIIRLGGEWQEELQRPRVNWIKNLLIERGIKVDSPYLDCRGVKLWTSDVCLAILEYYAFSSAQSDSAIALYHYRKLAALGFQAFVYSHLGYKPNAEVNDAWKPFHDRLSLVHNSVPDGFYCVFREISDLFVTLGDCGLHSDQAFIPDISVGVAWSKYWEAQGFTSNYGERKKYAHNYPEYFPQAESNPQNSWCYPEQSLGEFRLWCRNEYIGGGKLAKYLQSQVKAKKLPQDFTNAALEAFESPKKITSR